MARLQNTSMLSRYPRGAQFTRQQMPETDSEKAVHYTAVIHIHDRPPEHRGSAAPNHEASQVPDSSRTRPDGDLFTDGFVGSMGG